MSLVDLVILLIVISVLLWLANNYIPMDAKIKTILNIVIVISVALWILNAFGVIGRTRAIRVGSDSYPKSFCGVPYALPNRDATT